MCIIISILRSRLTLHNVAELGLDLSCKHLHMPPVFVCGKHRRTLLRAIGFMGEPLSDCSPLIAAASSGKRRLVRLLVEGGTQVNGRGPAGETPLLAACKALRGEPAGPGTLRLLAFLLHNEVGAAAG